MSAFAGRRATAIVNQGGDDGPGRSSNPLHAAYRDGRPLGDGPFGNPCGSEDLHLMPGHGVDHCSPFPGWRASAACPEKSVGSEPWVTRQNFRKGTRQSFRNQQWTSDRVPSIDEVLTAEVSEPW